MTAKEFLQLAWKIERRIDRKIEERERIESRLTSGRLPHLSGMPRGGRYDWTDSVASIIRLTESINAEISELCRIKQLVNVAIDSVQDLKLKQVLELRYRNYLTWEQIAGELAYDVRHVYRLHGEALLLIQVPDGFAC